MAQYDGSIRINTKIDSKQASAQLMTLENRIVKTADKIAGLRSKMDSLKDAKIPTQEYQNLQKELDAATKEMEKLVEQDSKLTDVEGKIKKLSQSSAEYAAKIKEVAAQKIPTEAYSSIQKQIEDAEKKLNSLQQKQEKFLATGGKQKSSAYKKMAYDADLLEKKLKNLYTAAERHEKKGIAFTSGIDTEQYKNLSVKYKAVNQELEKQRGIHSEIAAKQADAVQKTLELKNQMQQLVAEGKNFTLGKDTEEFSKLGQQLQYAENDMAVLNKRHDELIAKQGKASGGYRKLGNAAKKSFDKINKSAKKTDGPLGTMASRFKGLALSLLIFNQISKAFNAMISSIKQGFDNFYKGNENFKNSVDSLKASLLTLKNSFAAAFAPLVQTVIPYIQKAVEWLTVLIDKIGQFIAAVSGQKTYTKAIQQTTEAIKEQNKAQNKQLSGLDKLNNLTSDKDSGADDGGASDMFEEVPIDNGVLDFLQKIKDFLKPVIDYAKKLKDVFMQGFWDGLGDWEYRWESIKDSLKSIKDSLIDIWTDPAVLAAADGWAQSVVYMLGSLVGSLASIGLTIADNLLGGIAKYLEQNKDRIKEYLISMFNIWEEINYMFAELFQSIAYVFEAFASEQGQQLTANIIGIFADAFMGINELASKLFRDIANIIIQPFVDNKEGFRTALEGFLGVLADVTGTIKQGIDDTFDKLNEVYDEHFKPFFDSVAQGVSDLVGRFLEFWNSQVQPMLEQWAEDFDELWKGHIQPLLDNVADFLGKIADLLKVIWENILQPFIAWIIDNILPKVLPVLQAIWDAVSNFISYIADAFNGVITILGGIIDFLTGVFSGDWELAFQGLSDIVGGFVDVVVSIISGLGQLIYDVLKAAWELIKSLFEDSIESSKARLKAVKDWIKENIVDQWDEIKQRFSDFMENIVKKWADGWIRLKNNATTIINSIKKVVKEVFDWIADKVQAIMDKISGVRQSAKNMGLSFYRSPLLSGKSPLLYSRSYPTVQEPYAYNPSIAKLSNIEIPKLATGAVLPANREFLALVGDQKHGTNIEAPLGMIEEAVINAIAKVNADSGNNRSGNVTLEIPVIINGIGEIGRAMQQFDIETFKQTGRHAFS